MIQRINFDFFNRRLTDDEIKDMIKSDMKNEKTGIIYGVQKDKTLSSRVDLMDIMSQTPVRLRKKEYGDNKYDTTMRFGRNPETGEPIIRIPPTHRRVLLFEDETIVPENQAGYLVLLPKFIVCEFRRADMVLTHSGCKPGTIIKRKQRLSDIYHGIKSEELISIFLIDHFVDERYWFNYLNSRKTA